MTHAGQVEAKMVVPAGVALGATSSGVGPTAVSITAGSYTPTELTAHVQARLVAVKGAGWTCSLSTGATGTGKVFIRFTGSTYSVAWTSTLLRDALGFTADLTAVGSGVTSTSTNAARFLWIPDVPLVADGDLKQAPTVDDSRQVVSPTGPSVTLVGCDRYEHTGLQWSHVAINRMWITEETTVNQSYERFHLDAIRGNGHAWGAPGLPLVITDHRSIAVGSGTPATWKVIGPPALSKLHMFEGRYTGLWRVEWPKIMGAT